MAIPTPREPVVRDTPQSLEAISLVRQETEVSVWVQRMVWFLRAMAVLSMMMGLYHWALVTGFIQSGGEQFEYQPMAWQTATVFFAVLELVAAVGLWLASPWGAVVWLTNVVSMAVIEFTFPNIYGGNFMIVAVELALLVVYLGLAWMVARDRPS